MKYQIPYDQGENLPNKLGLTDFTKLSIAEFEGFIRSELILTGELTPHTKFDLTYLKRIHRLALVDIYDFAGRWRTVNLSKGGFHFASAQFLDQTMHVFEREFLSVVNTKRPTLSDTIEQAARIHAELLLIHPFREGNGRTTRALTNLIFRRSAKEPPDWSRLDSYKYEQYILGVQQASFQCYDLMIRLFLDLL